MRRSLRVGRKGINNFDQCLIKVSVLPPYKFVCNYIDEAEER